MTGRSSGTSATSRKGWSENTTSELLDFTIGTRAPARNPLDLGPAGAELLLHPLITAIQMVDAADNGLALGCQPRKDQADRGAEIRRHHRRSPQARDALDHRRAAMDLDIRPHAGQFRHMHETVLEDVLMDAAGADSEREKRHDLGLKVG